MKEIITSVLMILLCSNLTLSQDDKLIDEILLLTKERSIYSDNVDWALVSKKVRDAVNKDGNSAYERISPAVSVLLDELNDNHSFIKYKEQRTSRATKVDSFERVNENTRKAIATSNHKNINTLKLKDNIGYINIPGITVIQKSNEEKSAELIKKALCELNIENLEGIVIDLRLNTGGNMWPMLSGIAPLLTEGRIGSFVLGGKSINHWVIKNGNIYYGKRRRIKNKIKCYANDNIRIAVLIGPATGSSGEMTAISFLGQQNTKFFGERTAGYVTANVSTNIGKDLVYFLASTYVADRNKVEYKSAIEPDVEIIGGDNYLDLLNDSKVIEAVRWLENE